MPQYVAAIDQGTTSTCFIIFDRAENAIAVDQKEQQTSVDKGLEWRQWESRHVCSLIQCVEKGKIVGDFI